MKKTFDHFLAEPSPGVGLCRTLQVLQVDGSILDDLRHDDDLILCRLPFFVLPCCYPDVSPRHQACALPDQIVFGIVDGRWIAARGLLLFCVHVDGLHVPVGCNVNVVVGEFKLLPNGVVPPVTW